MTKAEYADYTATVEQFFKDEGVTNLSKIGDDEAFFSWRPCECCQRPEGGDRVNANGWNPTAKQVQEYVICSDCEFLHTFRPLVGGISRRAPDGQGASGSDCPSRGSTSCERVWNE